MERRSDGNDGTGKRERPTGNNPDRRERKRPTMALINPIHKASTPLTTHDSTLPETHPPSHTHPLTLCLHSPPHHNNRRLLYIRTTLRPPSIFSSSLYHSLSAATRPKPQQSLPPRHRNSTKTQRLHRSPSTAAPPLASHNTASDHDHIHIHSPSKPPPPTPPILLNFVYYLMDLA
ncbi:hypothetical protein ACFE04_021189 [Oxalis oulophora]